MNDKKKINTKSMRKCVLFCRVSSREQEETGYSLPAQEKFLREYAMKNGFIVIKAFAVSESASGRVSRKIFNEMIRYVNRKRISILIVETTDRLTRNFADVPMIDNWVLGNENHQIHLAKEGCVLEKNSRSHEWFMWRVKVATAEYYIRLLSENVRKGQKEKIAQGWLPTAPPLGYKTMGETGRKTHVIDEERGTLVRNMFELYSTGLYSIKALNEKMHQDGLRTRAGKRLSTSHTHRLLSDPFFMGKMRWKGRIYDGSQEPLVSRTLFERVQKILTRKSTPYYRRHNYLFSRAFRCSHCGRSICWEKQKNNVYGHCRFDPCPQKKWYKEPEIEAQLLDIFEQLKVKKKRVMVWVRKALKNSHQGQIAYRESSVSEFQKQHDRIQKRLDKLYDDRLDEVIDRQTYDRRFQQYTAEKERIEDRLKNYSQADTQYAELGMYLYDIFQNGREIYQHVNAYKKRIFLSLAFDKLLIDDGKIVYKFTKPVESLASAVKATNSSKIADLAELQFTTFEPAKNGLNKAKNRAFCPVHPSWLACWDRFRTFDWEKCYDIAELLLREAKNLMSLQCVAAFPAES
jgi:DNA invertase Pin-like site-specific DNA recombinase